MPAASPQQHQGPRGRRNKLLDAASAGSVKRTLAALSSTSVMDVNQGDLTGMTPLIVAAYRGSSPVVQLLLSKGASTSATTDNGFTALIAASQSGHLAVVNLLIAVGSDLEASTTTEGATPLFMAVTKGHTEVIGALIEAGANVNSRRPDGATPIIEAAMRGRIPPIRELVRAMADPQIPCTGEDGVDSVALDIAAQYGRVDVVRELVEQFGVRGCGGPSRGNEALRWAAQTGHADVVVVLMEDGGVVDRGTALIGASQHRQFGSVKLLLQRLQQQHPETGRSAAVNARDVCGRTPFVCNILFSTSPRIARMLVDAGADTRSAVAITNGISGMVVFNETPLALTRSILGQKTIAGRDATEEQLNGLEGIRRLLLRVQAVHAVSWLWLSQAPPPAVGGGKNATTLAPLAVLSPIVERRVARRGALLTALFRSVVTWQQ